MKPTRTLTRTVLACLAATLILAATVPASSAVAAAGPGPAPGPAAGPTLAAAAVGLLGPGGAGVTLPSQPAAARPGHAYPLWRLPRGERPSQRPGGHVVPDSVGEPGGYDPRELRAYLRLKGTGAGQTIAVTESFNVQNPLPVSTFGKQDDITHALAGYDGFYRLPTPCSAHVTTGCFHLRFVAPHGIAANPPPLLALSWTLEATLDVEVIHALAPRASIVVVEGHDDARKSLMAAVVYARGLHPAAVSNSWEVDEFSGERAMDSACPAKGPVCVFSSGDCGNYATSFCPAGFIGGYPAASPGVLAVGGTTLNLAATGTVVSETAWSGGGGGISHYEPLPGYQRAADPWHRGRGVPDVSFDADPNSGIATYIYLVPFNPSWNEVGGTSVGAPAWAAILASAGQLRAAAGKPPLTSSAVHAAVYAQRTTKPLADITLGANGVCFAVCSARAGYDLVTGEGSPRPGIDIYLAKH